MPDLRLLAPAGFAWLAAWLAVAAPDAGVPPWTAAAICWSTAVVALGVLAASVWLRPAGSAGPASAAVVGDAAASAPHSATRARFVRFAATALTVLSAGGLVASAAAAAIDTRSDSPLAAAAAEFRTARVVVELTGAPRALSSPWSDGAEHPQLRIEGRAVAVDGRTVEAVPVVAMGPAPRTGLQL